MSEQYNASEDVRSDPNGKNQTKTTAAERARSRRRMQRTKTLVSLLPVIITGATFILSFGAQIWQQHVQAEATRDSEWRKALQHVSSTHSETAIQGAYEMVSFLDDKRYGAQARAIANALLPNISDHIAFDLVFFSLIEERANQNNEGEFIAIDSSLAKQLELAYWKAKTAFDPKSTPKDASFENFLMHPELFLHEDAQSEQLGYVLNKVWELDSVSNGLARLWSGQRGVRHATLDGQGLNDLVFINNDFSDVDFSRAGGMENVIFAGHCKVNPRLASLKGATVECVPLKSERTR